MKFPKIFKHSRTPEISTDLLPSLEEAKSYFIKMGCSHFHIAREDFELRDAYHRLNIPTETEEEWRQEEIQRNIDRFPFDKPETIGYSFTHLSDLINRRNSNNLEAVTHLANRISSNLLADQIQLVLSAIIGNDSSPTRGGLIEAAASYQRKDLAQKLAEVAKQLLIRAEEENISLLWLRGYFVDVAQAMELEGSISFLATLRQKDNKESFSYYLSGAKEENIYSMRMISKCYSAGTGCDIDRKKAIFWMEKAADKGNELAKEELAKLKQNSNQAGDDNSE